MYDMLRRSPRPFSAPGPPGYHPPPLAPYSAEVRGVPESELPQPTQRPLQPRPPRSTDSPIPATTNGEPFRILRPFAPPDPPGERRKKRGRPTKEEAEERDRRLAETGQIYEPKKRPAKRSRPSETHSLLPESLPSTSPIMSTPLLQHVEPREETSSGKRRSRRQQDGEGEGEESSRQDPSRSPPDDSGDGRSIDAQSPSDRLLARPERSQAVASVARDVQQTRSPYLEPQQPAPRPDDPPSGPPSG